MLGQLLGVGVVSSLYYFLYYISTPIEKFKATDMRLTRLNYSLAILPVLIVCYYTPVFAMLYWPTRSGREAWLFLWQMFPLWISLAGLFVSSFIPNTTMSDRIKAPKRDLPVMRYTIGILAAISASIWIWSVLGNFSAILTIFVPDNFPRETSTFMAFTRDFLKVDELFLFGNTFLWLSYLFRDLKHAGMINTTWLSLVLYCGCSVILFGPGATVALGWLYREDAITNKRHKGALTQLTTRAQEKQ
jgi:hypothetical protein